MLYGLIVYRKVVIFVCTILYRMKELNLHKIDFLVALIAEFGKRFGLSSIGRICIQ